MIGPSNTLSLHSPYSDNSEQSSPTMPKDSLSPLHSNPHQDALEVTQIPFLFSKLPVEIQLQIMGFLPPEAFANLRCVNKPTEKISRDFIHRLRISDPGDIPLIPLTLKKFGAKHNLSIKLIGSDFTGDHLAALPTSLTGLDFTECSELETNDLVLLLSKCHELKSLKLPSSFLIRNEVLSSIRQPSKLEELYIPDYTKITSEGLISLLSQCNNLKNLRLPRMNRASYGWQVNDEVLSSIPQPSKLETLKIKGAEEVMSDYLSSKLLPKLNGLKVLHIKGIRQMTPEVFGRLEQCSNLRVLSLGFFNRCEAMGFKSMLRQFAQSHTLEELDISSLYPLMEEGILAQIPQISSLKSLTLSGDVYGQPGDLQSMLSQFAQSQNLEKLEINHPEDLTDELLIQISQISSLKSLVLNSNSKYTSAGLQSMLSQFAHFNNLEELTITLEEKWEDDIHQQLTEILSLKSLVLLCRGPNQHKLHDCIESIKTKLKKVKITIFWSG